MEPMTIGALTFGLMFGAALAGMRLRAVLPEGHFSAKSEETVKITIGLIATMTALILGLVTASAKSSFDAVDTAMKHTAADLLTLDRTLARYGPQSDGIRAALKQAVKERVETTWFQDSSGVGGPDPDRTDVAGAEELADRIRRLSPQDEGQRWLQSRALDQAESVLQARWLLFSGVGSSVPVPFLTVLVFWLGLTFFSFGLFAPRNGVVIACFFLSTLSVAGAIFLILEMDDPFRGLVTISPDPMRYAHSRIGQ